jgi:hypothetical protein
LHVIRCVLTAFCQPIVDGTTGTLALVIRGIEQRGAGIRERTSESLPQHPLRSAGLASANGAISGSPIRCEANARRQEGLMPGASEKSRRVRVLNANWVPDRHAGDGAFEVLMVTDDDERHVVPASAASVAALAALVQTDPVLVWDPEGRSLIVANIVGEMSWTLQGR